MQNERDPKEVLTEMIKFIDTTAKTNSVFILAHNGNKFDFKILLPALEKYSLQRPSWKYVDTINFMNIYSEQLPTKINKAGVLVPDKKAEAIYYHLFNRQMDFAHAAIWDVFGLANILLRLTNYNIQQLESHISLTLNPVKCNCSGICTHCGCAKANRQCSALCKKCKNTCSRRASTFSIPQKSDSNNYIFYSIKYRAPRRTANFRSTFKRNRR